MTTPDLDRLAALEAAATPAPWQVVDYEDEDGDAQRYVGMKDIGHGWWDADSTMLTAEDATFIAAARNAAPTLIATARSYERLLAAVGRVCEAQGVNAEDVALAELAAVYEALTGRAVRDG